MGVLLSLLGRGPVLLAYNRRHHYEGDEDSYPISEGRRRSQVNY